MGVASARVPRVQVGLSATVLIGCTSGLNRSRTMTDDALKHGLKVRAAPSEAPCKLGLIFKEHRQGREMNLASWTVFLRVNVLGIGVFGNL
jgi:hypothetical protein